MKRSFLLVILMAVLVCALQVAFAQEYEQYVQNGNGARAAGMGYAFTGLADDATAISWNSAGLTQLYSPEASVIARFGWGSLTPDYPDLDIDVTSGSSFQLNFASLALPFHAGNINVVGGVAYRRVYDFTSNFTIKLSQMGMTYEIEQDNSGGIDAITPAVGIQFNEMISAGVAGNILMGSTDYKSTERLNGQVESEGSYSEEYSGFGLDIGVLVKPSPQFQLGANFQLPTTVTTTEKNQGFDDYEYKLKVPLFFSIGAAFRASDNVTLAADYRSRPWSSAKQEFDGEEYDLEAENANSFHVGLEYLAQAGDNIMPLRVGFYTVPTPGKDENDDQITFNTVTAGLGLILGNIILDGSFEYMFGSYVGDTQDGQDIDYSQSNFRVTVGGTIHFGKN
jgi:long-subunit fatty acid transport protein